MRTDVVEKAVMGSRAFMVDGSMCCAVSDAGLLVRVEPCDRDQLLNTPHVVPMKLGARTMRGFVRVAPAGYRTDAALKSWLARGAAAGSKTRAPHVPAGDGGG
jgi:hypothetical protein